jgi:NAD(P)-dependent dehydrogenase (short-subunit alcohol dehydrogenase family)
MNIRSQGKILITGGTSGLGLELVRRFHSKGYDVYTLGRVFKGSTPDGGRFHFIKTDFSGLIQLSKTIYDLLEGDLKFDIIINNAGILSPPDYNTTADGMELSFQVNFLSHLLIDELIINSKKDSEPLLVISVTSPVYKYTKPDYIIPVKESYSPFKAYAESKYYLLLLGEHFRRLYPEKNFTFISFNPGTFASGIYRMQNRYFHTLYRIAAPFMRSAGKVADMLIKIVENTDLQDGCLYKKFGTHGVKPLIDNEAAGEFMLSCWKIVSQASKQLP